MPPVAIVAGVIAPGGAGSGCGRPVMNAAADREAKAPCLFRAALEPGKDQSRQTVMTRMPGRAAQVHAAVTALALMAAAVTACGTSRPSSRTAIPPEFRAACGHPGARAICCCWLPG